MTTTSIVTAITLDKAIALFASLKNERVLITSGRPITLLGGKKNAMQGKVIKTATYPVYIGSQHSYAKKLEKEGKKIATSESIEEDKEFELMDREIKSLWGGHGVHVGGGIVKHDVKETLYLYFYPIAGADKEVSYTFEGKEITPEKIEGFNEKIREGAKVEISDGETVSEQETKVFPTALGVDNLKSFRIGGNDYMVIDNI